MNPQDLRTSTDERFLADCQVETFRGPGPGGQKRNKTSSAVRITHKLTGLNAVAGESRSQAQNRANALRRLRLRVVIELRQPIDLGTFSLPIGFSLKVSERNAAYPQVVGLVLDVLSACEWETGSARMALGVGSRPFTRFLRDDPELWIVVQSERAARGLRTLTSD